jgi:hypothetical protein
MIFNPKGRLVIYDYASWMDGGTLTLKTRDQDLSEFEIEFVQKTILIKQPDLPFPGSLLLNKEEVEIRSVLETQILIALRAVDTSPKIPQTDKMLLNKMISDCLEFITSDSYIEVAKKIGRVK